MNQEDYRKLISGGKTGLVASACRSALCGASRLYGPLIACRNFLYDHNWLKSRCVSPNGVAAKKKLPDAVPVICVGNITTGGTGKTPLVAWLCTWLGRNNISSAVLTRGYKTDKAELSDEPAILAKNCPQTHIIVNADRVAGAAKAVAKYHPDLLIMDDGFQHRRLKRDIDIVTIDATLPFGYDKLLPAGLLREAPTALKRAHAVVITRCDQVPPYKLTRIENKIREINPNIPIAQTVHAPIAAIAIGNKQIPLEQLKTKRIFAFCGIGNPDAFFKTLEKLNLTVAGSKIFDDHYRYTSKDTADLFAEAQLLKADLILTTQKDWIKTACPSLNRESIPFAYLAIGLKFTSGQQQITQLIEQTLEGRIHKERNPEIESGVNV